MRTFANLQAFASHLEKLRVVERSADIMARGAVANELTVEIQRRFGKPSLLKPYLQASTIRERVRLGFTTPSRDATLLRTGALRQSISWAHTGSRETGVGSNSPYAIYHELGGRIKGRPPKRSFMAASARYLDKRIFATFCRVYREKLGL